LHTTGRIQDIAMRLDRCHPEYEERVSQFRYPQIENDIVNAMKFSAVFATAQRLYRVKLC